VADVRTMKKIGLLGGTFDPIHLGHIRMAQEFKAQLGLDEMRLLPCHLPPHKAIPARTSAQRLAMVQLALKTTPELQVDARELSREQASYTIDTLVELRREQGTGVALCWCVGMDSLVSLNRWHRWRELLDYAHLVVATRPGWSLPTSGEVAGWLAAHRVDAQLLSERAAGGVVVAPLSLVDVSSTQLREALAGLGVKANTNWHEQLPAGVYDYIEQQQLYR